jgi:hypothetical protein
LDEVPSEAISETLNLPGLFEKLRVNNPIGATLVIFHDFHNTKAFPIVWCGYAFPLFEPDTKQNP